MNVDGELNFSKLVRASYSAILLRGQAFCFLKKRDIINYDQ